MYNFSNDSRNAWMYLFWTLTNLVGGYYIFCLWHPELQGYIRLNLIVYVLSMAVQMYWCIKYMVKEIKWAEIILSEGVNSWKQLLNCNVDFKWSIPFTKSYFYSALGCDEDVPF